MKRKCPLLLLMVLVTIMPAFLTSCFDSREIDEMAYVMALGLDKGQTNNLRMTLQLANPARSSSGEGGGGGESKGGGGGGNTSITTIESPTIYAGLNMINTYISKEINFAHCKVVVFSRELAREGIFHYIHAMIRGREFRGNMYVAVSMDTAEDYIRNVVPTLELNPSKYYEMNFAAHRYTGFSGDTSLTNFYLLSECTCRQAYATLVGVNKYESSGQFDNSNSSYGEKGRDLPAEGDFYAGSIPKVYEIKSEVMGIAAFDGGTMVGEFDGEEALFHQMLYGTYNRSYISVPDPLHPEEFVLLHVNQNRMPSHKVEMVGDKPYIYARVKLEADILSIQSGFNYESIENIEILESAAEEFLKKGMLRFLEKTKPLHLDLCGFGRYLKNRSLSWDEWTRLQWLKKYADSEFQVDVDLKIRRTGLIVRTAPAKGSEGDVMR